MPYAQVFQMPLEFDLKFMAVISTDCIDAKRELGDGVINEVDRILPGIGSIAGERHVTRFARMQAAQECYRGASGARGRPRSRHGGHHSRSAGRGRAGFRHQLQARKRLRDQNPKQSQAYF